MNTFRNVERLQMVEEMNKQMQVFNRKNYINEDAISLNGDVTQKLNFSNDAEVTARYIFKSL